MEKINHLINKSPIHLTTNTIILMAVAIFAFYFVIKAIEGIVKIIAIIGVCYFVLMSLQSTNLFNKRNLHYNRKNNSFKRIVDRNSK